MRRYNAIGGRSPNKARESHIYGKEKRSVTRDKRGIEASFKPSDSLSFVAHTLRNASCSHSWLKETFTLYSHFPLSKSYLYIWSLLALVTTLRSYCRVCHAIPCSSILSNLFHTVVLSCSYYSFIISLLDVLSIRSSVCLKVTENFFIL